MNSKNVVLITGFPDSLLSIRVARALLDDPAVQLRLIPTDPVESKQGQKLRDFFTGTKNWEERTVLLDGCAHHLDFGLSGSDYNHLAEEVTVIHQLGFSCSPSTSARRAGYVNVGSAREAVELAEAAANLHQLVHWSTTSVAGKRTGFILENELLAPDGFFSHADAARFRAERLVKEAGKRLPVTILRPSTIVGDSKTGETDQKEGPYVLIKLLESAPSEIPIPFPGNGEFPLNLVPIDHVVKAGLAIAGDDRSIGRTFHIVDSNPLTALRVFEALAKAMDKPAPRGSLSGLSEWLLRLPGLRRFASAPTAFIEQLSVEAAFDDSNTKELLKDHPIPCPPFEDYVAAMVAFARGEPLQKKRKGPSKKRPRGNRGKKPGKRAPAAAGPAAASGPQPSSRSPGK